MQKAVEYWKSHKIFDISANITDTRFEGMYFGKKIHQTDVDLVIKRARKFGVHKFLISNEHLEGLVKSL